MPRRHQHHQLVHGHLVSVWDDIAMRSFAQSRWGSSQGKSNLLSAQAADGYNCVFPSGKVHTFENDVFQEDNASKLSFEIGDIKLDLQTASLITRQGKGELKIAADSGHVRRL